MRKDRIYACIDLKTFFASCECVLRRLNPFTTNLVVADPDRGKGTITLAITPKMKMLGVKNRCRLYEIPPTIEYIIAKPRINTYMNFSANIYEMYLEYFCKDDIHVYSIDEVFIDITDYLKIYKTNATNLVKALMNQINIRFGLEATAGIGTNLYLAKIALDIISKHNSSNIGVLNEQMYIKKLGDHRPISDFWNIGSGIEKRLAKYGIYTMNDIAKTDEKLLYKEFGVNAKYLIDHSKGVEPCTIKQIKEYVPKDVSIANSQILFRDFNFEDAKLIIKEMIELGVLRLVEQKYVTDTIGLYIGYSKDIAKPLDTRCKIQVPTNSYHRILEIVMNMYEKKALKNVPIRRVGFCFSDLSRVDTYQRDLLEDDQKAQKEYNLFSQINNIKQTHGRDKIIRAMDLLDDGISLQRNMYIGGHNAKY